jgi:hypothetical protein
MTKATATQTKTTEHRIPAALLQKKVRITDGPFASGSWGTTLLPGQEPLRWQIRDVRPGAAFIMEVPLDGAVISFEWLFDAVSNYRTRITQRIVLSGDNATAYVSQVQAGFGSNLSDGMKRIADAMARAERGADE